MLVKEYRIGLPMTVDEYRIAQLYMIQKKSREESSGAGSGVEILVNEPYKDGPGGDGQYTYKIYHIGSHLPGWLKAILPKNALRVEEEAWNAYPYTKTRYRCPFIERFTLEIETRYINDGGEIENVFELSDTDLRNRTVDFLDIVLDPISSGDYRREEDPKIFFSDKTGRGPLTETWRLDYVKEINENPSTTKKIMTAYKLCRVEFKYWGMQTKIEKFIHDIGLRKTMLRAHRQAWAWQDEYYGLTIDDIRELERQTQEALKEKMSQFLENGEVPEDQLPNTDEELVNHSSASPSALKSSEEKVRKLSESGSTKKISWGTNRMRKAGSNRNVAQTMDRDWRVDSIEKLQDSSSDDEFFDAEDVEDAGLHRTASKLYRTSSMEMVNEAFSDCSPADQVKDSNFFTSSFDRKLEYYRHLHGPASQSIDMGPPQTPSNTTFQCKTSVLFLVLHGGSILETGQEQTSKRTDIGTFRTTFDAITRAHYPSAHSHIALRLVPCPPVCTEALSVLSSLSPYSFDAQSPGLTTDSSATHVTNDYIPLGAIPLLTTSAHDYRECLSKVIVKANHVYHEFLRSEEGRGFSGQVCFVGDSVGSIFGYDALCQAISFSRANSHNSSHGSIHESDHEDGENQPVFKKSNLETIKQLSVSNPDLTPTEEVKDITSDHSRRFRSETVDCERTRHQSVPNSPYTRHLSLPTSRGLVYPEIERLDFEVMDFFMFGAPLGLVLAFRRILSEDKHTPTRPHCHQIYNLFHPTDPSASRIEPLLNERFKYVSPLKTARYNRYPLGDGESIHVDLDFDVLVEAESKYFSLETIQSNAEMLFEHNQDKPTLERRTSNMSIVSQISGHGEINLSSIAAITKCWWGTKRIDYALYCPEALHTFPTNALPHLFHASYWESSDVVAFILRQVVRHESASVSHGGKEVAVFTPSQPREKWIKRRTTIKLRNVGPNHRANDCIVVEDAPQILTARFMYGPLDMVSLSGEKVDIHVMTQPPMGDWQYFGTEVTDSNGRITYQIPDDKKLSLGMYPIKIVVRGDHTSVDFYLSVLPPKTESIVFSIDGSFTASMSIMGKDPKVRAGAVDVVRHWQELGYLILYITARPDMQHKKVVAWLAQHNFPHGMVSFMDGLSADPLRQKGNFLRGLINEGKIEICGAYGSAKDISVYQALGLQPNQIYIVGKASKKQHNQAEILSEGYASHLSDLTAPGGSRPAIGNARMVIRKGCFGLPGQERLKRGKSSKKSAKRTTSLPPVVSEPYDGIIRNDPASAGPGICVSEAGNTVIDAGLLDSGKAVRQRGTSPRAKMPEFRYESRV
ncbi:protein retinal degeneration B-like [Tubulanus polymorphus]|uniref:protein retinal degeneration B-like n=1 Tax=Tubulanus polymorphus TaxID=672921 RepID=UPI003DA3B019